MVRCGGSGIDQSFSWVIWGSLLFEGLPLLFLCHFFDERVEALLAADLVDHDAFHVGVSACFHEFVEGGSCPAESGEVGAA